MTRMTPKTILVAGKIIAFTLTMLASGISTAASVNAEGRAFSSKLMIEKRQKFAARRAAELGVLPAVETPAKKTAETEKTVETEKTETVVSQELPQQDELHTADSDSQPVREDETLEEEDDYFTIPADDSLPADTQPTVEGQQTENSQPVVEDQPAETNQPVVEEQPAENSQPVVEEQPAENSQPVVEEQPAETNQPVVEEQPAENSQPVVEDQQTDESQKVANAKEETLSQDDKEQAPKTDDTSSENEAPAQRDVTPFYDEEGALKMPVNLLDQEMFNLDLPPSLYNSGMDYSVAHKESLSSLFRQLVNFLPNITEKAKPFAAKEQNGTVIPVLDSKLFKKRSLVKGTMKQTVNGTATNHTFLALEFSVVKGGKACTAGVPNFNGNFYMSVTNLAPGTQMAWSTALHKPAALSDQEWSTVVNTCLVDENAAVYQLDSNGVLATSTKQIAAMLKLSTVGSFEQDSITLVAKRHEFTNSDGEVMAMPAGQDSQDMDMNSTVYAKLSKMKNAGKKFSNRHQQVYQQLTEVTDKVFLLDDSADSSF